MEELLKFLPIVLYILGIILLVVLIILGIKLIRTINRTNDVLDDVYKKSKSLNGLFDTIDAITDTLANVSDNVVGLLSKLFSKIFSIKKKTSHKLKEEKEDNEDE